LYGFNTEQELKVFLERQPVILDAGCGLGYKAAWFAELAPNSLVIGMDYSEAANVAREVYAHLPNLFFIRGDIADTHLKKQSVAYVSCDQVIHHTENPEKTFRHLTERITPGGEFSCYVYAKKALPRELLDEHFRTFSKECSKEELWALSEQVTQLGKQLSELKIELDFPDMPLLGIKGGKQDLQRFIYWNFIKCYWNAEQDLDTSVSTNYDWYSPSNASRYSKEEFLEWITDNQLTTNYFHEEEACYSGRFSNIC
ncbi:MAG: class I SAM-dependent methyltransferase, partial [Bacteroidetes bacterium]|nr:class I SAM-dependent methyltransferase [Bacteroidota bacterium]